MAVVVTVSKAVCEAVPVSDADDGATPQVAGLVAPVGPDTAQVNAMVPVNPPSGVTVMVEVLLVLTPAPSERFPLLVRAKLWEPAGEPVTTAWIPKVWMNWPVAASLPVIITL